MAMANAANIKEHMQVLGSDGQHVGTVDHIDSDDKIKLAKADPASGGRHHQIPLDWVDTIDEHVHLSVSAQQARQQWTAID